MRIRRRTRRIRRWYRRHEYSSGMLAARLALLISAAVAVATVSLVAIQTM